MIQIGKKPAPTFHQPLELLSDCHRRIEDFLRALILVTEQAHGGELDSRQREALEVALRYFREAAPRHTADEEVSLFPRMREAGKSAEEVLQKIQTLESDHQVANRYHDLVEKLGQKWLSAGYISSEECNQLRETLHELRSIYERHIAIEDHEIFPTAAKVLDQDALNKVGREMAERRGQNFDWHIRFPRS